MLLKLVRMKRFELLRAMPGDFKSPVSTNSTTLAKRHSYECPDTTTITKEIQLWLQIHYTPHSNSEIKILISRRVHSIELQLIIPVSLSISVLINLLLAQNALNKVVSNLLDL